MKLLLSLSFLVFVLFAQSQNCIFCSKKDLLDIGAAYYKAEDNTILYKKNFEQGFWLYSLNVEHDIVDVQILSLHEKEYTLAMVQILNEQIVKVSSTEWVDYVSGYAYSVQLKYDEGYYFMYKLKLD